MHSHSLTKSIPFGIFPNYHHRILWIFQCILRKRCFLPNMLLIVQQTIRTAPVRWFKLSVCASAFTQSPASRAMSGFLDWKPAHPARPSFTSNRKIGSITPSTVKVSPSSIDMSGRYARKRPLSDGPRDGSGDRRVRPRTASLPHEDVHFGSPPAKPTGAAPLPGPSGSNGATPFVSGTPSLILLASTSLELREFQWAKICVCTCCPGFSRLATDLRLSLLRRLCGLAACSSQASTLEPTFAALSVVAYIIVYTKALQTAPRE